MGLTTQEDIRDKKVDGNPSGLSLKLFAHKINIGGKEESIFETNAYTILYIETITALNVVAASQSINTTIINENNRIDGSKQKLEQISAFNVQADENIQDFFEKTPYVYTLEEKLDIGKARTGEQEIFISRETLPSKINKKLANSKLYEELDLLESINNKTNYDLINIQEINQLTNSSIVFTYNKRILNPKKIRLDYDKSWAFQKIIGKGIVDNDFTELDFTIDENSTLLGLFKLTPISTINKLTCFSDTLDLNISLPYEIGQKFIAPNNLRSQIVNDETTWKKDLWQTFLSVITLTKAFSNNFSEYSTLNKTNGKYEIDPNATIGGIKLGQLPSTTDALTAIDGRIENWKQLNPTRLTSNEYKLFKIFILMLSPFIQSSLSLGNGLNQSNKIYKLWWFDLRTSIKKDLADLNTNDIEVQLKSEYYDIFINNLNSNDPNNGNLTLKPQFKNLSIYQAIDIDGWASVSELPNQLTTINRISKPGDINTASEDLTKYYLYFPFDNQISLKSSYGTSSSSFSGGNEEKTIDYKGTYIEEQSYPGRWNRTSEQQREIGTIYRFTCVPNGQSIDHSNFKLDAVTIYNQLLKNNLPVGYKMNFIGGVPNIFNIKVLGVRTTSDQSGNFQESQTSIRPDYTPQGSCNGGTNSYYDFTCTYKVTKIINTTKLKLSASEAIKDKYLLQNFNRENYLSNNFINILLNIDSKNQSSIVSEINQLILIGMYGTEFHLTIEGENEFGESETLTLYPLEFVSKFDETQTTTKINL